MIIKGMEKKRKKVSGTYNNYICFVFTLTRMYIGGNIISNIIKYQLKKSTQLLIMLYMGGNTISNIISNISLRRAHTLLIMLYMGGNIISDIISNIISNISLKREHRQIHY